MGTCFAWAAAGGVPQRAGMVVQQCGVGLVEVRQEPDDTLAFAAPPMRRDGPLTVDERAEAARLAGVDAAAVIEGRWADNGPPWHLLVLESAEAVLAARPEARAPLGACVALAGPGGDADWELRAFFADQHGTLKEDPVTGSLNAGVARLMLGRADAPERLLAAQGRSVGADGRISWTQGEGGAVWVGGRCDMVAQGAGLS